MLERLVESKLIIAAAKQADMTVDEEAIQQSVEQKIQQFVEHFGSMETLERELARSGMTLARLPDPHGHPAARPAVPAPGGGQVHPAGDRGPGERGPRLLPGPSGRDARRTRQPDHRQHPDPGAAVASRCGQGSRTRWPRSRPPWPAGRTFEDVAGEYSRGPNAERGGAVGVVAPGDLFDRNLDRAVFALRAGRGQRTGGQRAGASTCCGWTRSRTTAGAPSARSSCPSRSPRPMWTPPSAIARGPRAGSRRRVLRRWWPPR